nr:CaiB/BaiF CoA-transferase family protein [Rhabdothermincola salaria]
MRVLDLSRLYPGAYCTLLLADLGADVVKVEAPGRGDGLRDLEPGEVKAVHSALNRGKRSMTLNLKHDRAREVLDRLVRQADVIVESHRPGQLDALGLGYDDLRAENPRLVWCSITGFGSTGPRAQAPGHDLTYLGAAGVLSQLGQGEHPRQPDVVLTVPVGALTAVVGILAAVAERDRTGEGARVDASITEAVQWVMSDAVTRHVSGAGPEWGQFAASAVYRCADGAHVTLTATEPRSWKALCEALDAPDLVDHRMGIDDEVAAAARLAELFDRRPAADWLADPGLAGGVGPVLAPADLPDDEQVKARRGVLTLDDGLPVVANPVRVGTTDGDEASLGRTRPPALGEHAADVLAAAGYDAEAIEALRADGVI